MQFKIQKNILSLFKVYELDIRITSIVLFVFLLVLLTLNLTFSSSVLHFIQKPVIWFADI